MTIPRCRVEHLTEDDERVAQAVLERRLDGLWTIRIPARRGRPPRRVEAVISAALE
jgi:hypothetical protein